jgi:hypothetical protein
LPQAGANELGLEIGQPNIVSPGIGADRDVMAAAMVRAAPPRTSAERISANVIFCGRLPSRRHLPQLFWSDVMHIIDLSR